MTLRKLGLYLFAPAFVLFTVMLFGAQSADAANLYYVGTTDDYTTAASWHSSDKACDDSGGAGAAPGASDTAIFGGSCDTNVTIPAGLTLIGVTSEAGYTGTATQGGNLTLTGAFLHVSGATFDSAGYALDVAGDWTNAGTFTSGSGTVKFNGTSGTQTITTGGTTAGFDFNNVEIDNSGTEVQLATNDIDIDANLTITAGTLDINALDLTAVGTFSNDGILSLDGTETVTLAAMDVDSGAFLYTGTGTYTELIAGDTYYDLMFNGSGGQWTLDAALNVDGDMTITAGTIITGGNDITLATDWSNAGTFTHGTDQITLDGSGAQTLTGDTTFYDLIASASAARTLTINAGDTITASNIFTVSGANNAILSIESSTAGTVASIDASAATKTVSFLSPKDITSVSGLILCDTGCINRGNNANWTIPADEVTEDGSGGTITSSAALLAPTTGSSLTGGDTADITWTAAAEDLDHVKLSFSSDGGVTYEVIADNLSNSGAYAWTAPNVDTLKGMLKISVYNTSNVEAISDESGRFSITAVEGLVTEDETDTEVTDETFTEVLMTDTSGNEVSIAAGGLFRGESLSGVYLVKEDGTRSVFPNAKVFESHGYSFDNVVMVEDDQLQKLALGDRVTMAAGELVKIQSDNRVFEIGSDGLLHHVPSEDTALSLFGANWASLITDISVVFWGDYTIGASL